MVDLLAMPDVVPMTRFDKPLDVNVKRQRLLDNRPWVRILGNIEMAVQTEGWKFPAPPPGYVRPPMPNSGNRRAKAGKHVVELPTLDDKVEAKPKKSIPRQADLGHGLVQGSTTLFAATDRSMDCSMDRWKCRSSRSITNWKGLPF